MAKKSTSPAKVAAPKSDKSTTGNLPLEDARLAVLKVLAKGRANRTALKSAAPYGNYSALMGVLEEEGLVKVEKLEEDTHQHYTITAKGRKVK